MLIIIHFLNCWQNSFLRKILKSWCYPQRVGYPSPLESSMPLESTMADPLPL